MSLVCIRDYEKRAAELLGLRVLNYYKCGEGEMTTQHQNSECYKQLRLRPKCLQDVSTMDLSSTVLGFNSSMPIGIAPSAAHHFAHSEGELATARAAEKAGVIFILSSYSYYTIEDVAEAAPNLTKWMQLYLFKDRDISERLLRRAERSGYKAIVLTVDSPYRGSSYEIRRHGQPDWLNWDRGNFLSTDEDSLDGYFDRSLTWEGVKWLVNRTKLPVIAKGILRGDDALKAIEAGCQAVIVSNHGGRNLDTTPATIEVLPEVLEAVGGRVPVMIDGGITLGTDVIKALALGAHMVFIGRPILWGLAVDGQSGVEEILSILKHELESSMLFCGAASQRHITRDLVEHAGNYRKNLMKWVSDY